MLDTFNAYLLDMLARHSIYVWGAQGQTGSQITEDWIRRRETTTDNFNRVVKFWKKQVAAGFGDKLYAFDCSGLGMYFLQNLHGIFKTDLSAHGMMGNCTKITKTQLKRGDWVFRVDSKGEAYHIGYVWSKLKAAIMA